MSNQPNQVAGRKEVPRVGQLQMSWLHFLIPGTAYVNLKMNINDGANPKNDMLYDPHEALKPDVFQNVNL